MSEELKSCPFCGAKAEFSDLSYLTGKPSWCISCTSSKCFAPHTDTCSKKEAVERWNNRPIEEALQKRITELEAERDRLREALNLIGTKADFCADECEYGPDATSFRLIADDAKRALKGAEQEVE